MEPESPPPAGALLPGAGGIVALAREALNGLMAVAGFVQFLDVGLDAAEGRMALGVGVIALGALFSLAAARMDRRLFWKAALDPSVEGTSARGESAGRSKNASV